MVSKEIKDYYEKYIEEQNNISKLEKFKDDIFYAKNKKMPISKILLFLEKRHQLKTSYSNLYGWLQRNQKRLEEFSYKEQEQEIANNKTKPKAEDKDTKIVTKKPKNDIPIKLVDGSIDMCNERYLRTCAIMDLDSRVKNDFLEENIYLIENTFQGKNYNFDEYAKKIKEKQIIENYSLVIHNNSNKDFTAYVYRYIDNELVLLYDFSAAELLDIEIIERKARNKFLNTKEFFNQ